MNINTALNLQIRKSINITQILPRVKEERARKFLTICMSFIAVIFFSIFAIAPTFNTISDINKKISDDQFVDLQLTQKIANLTKLQEQYVLIQNYIPHITNAIPTTAQTTLFLAQLQAIADKSKVQLQRAQILPVEENSTTPTSSQFNSFSFSIDATGSTQTVDNFLKNLNNFNRLVLVTDFSIVEQAANSNALRVDIKGKAYFKS